MAKRWMTTTVKFEGTKLPLTFMVNPTFTGRDLKGLLHTRFNLPYARQTLFLLPAGTPLDDDSSLESHGIEDGDYVDLKLEVEVDMEDGDEHQIAVNLVVPDRKPVWRRTVNCFEKTTVLGFKNLVREMLEWEDFGGMELAEGGFSTAMDGDGDGITADYLVVDGGTVEVVFNDRVPSDLPAAAAEEEED